MERVTNVVMAQQDTMQIIGGFIFHNHSQAGCVKFVRCITTVVDHLNEHFQQDLAKAHHIHLKHLSNMLYQILTNLYRTN